MIASLDSESRGFVPKDDDDFVLDVEACVIVVVKLVGGCAVSGEHNGRGHLSRRREAEGHIVLFDRKRLFFVGGLHYAAIVGLQACTGDDAERLYVSLHPCGLNVEFLVAFLDEMLGASQAFGPGAAAFHLRGRQRLDIGDVSVGIGLRRGRRRQHGCGNGENCEQPVDTNQHCGSPLELKNRMVAGKACQPSRVASWIPTP